MRWERGQDPVTWTSVDNAMIDADLSARAQGLLLRWLRRPPGAEIDDIGAMVKRSKREGKKRLEGRDALYKASYELEEEGFLVREQERGRAGQYEWVVRIYSSPVHPDKRSNPEDRKRAPRVRVPQKPRSAPVPEKPELVDQESADQESADQELSFKNSVNDSLSGHGRPPGDGSEPGGEREAAAPEGGASAAAGVPGPRGDVGGDSGVVLAETVAMLAGLPGGTESAARRLGPLAVAGVAAGWTVSELRAHLVRNCDPERVRYAPAVYEKHLRELPAPPRARPEQRPGREMCERHPAFVAGDCSPCRRAEMNRQQRGASEPGPVDGAGLLARVRAGTPAGGAR